MQDITWHDKLIASAVLMFSLFLVLYSAISNYALIHAIIY